MRYEFSDGEWATIRPMLPNKARGVPRVDDRRILNGIFWVLRSGAPWRDLPSAFGPYTTCYNRFVRWRRAGVWGRIIAALAAAHDAAVQMIDTTSSPPTTSRSSSLRRYAYGCALMSSRPRLASRFQSSQNLAAHSRANFGIKGTLANL